MGIDIGEYISKQSENAEYGDVFVQKPADFFANLNLNYIAAKIPHPPDLWYNPDYI